MNAWTTTNRWYQHWRHFIRRLKTESLSAEDRDLVARSATLAQAEYVMALAEENRAEEDGR
jgi:heme oxygenase